MSLNKTHLNIALTGQAIGGSFNFPLAGQKSIQDVAVADYNGRRYMAVNGKIVTSYKIDHA